ncbi:migration and invasion-inhibitory protein-like [Acipenser oxyrinchus oxyrinchus]|uniref:Migration and invasion-inhibitory protein-like n=1 Tax=Acipenser oxyrinchus oxyrinchus TaxID=40147 RepID=A0AAD8CZB1_ACIOX|nr:migration and invasion-inhibitory protein-like [Acipenser oxyrinchus oxyrinchus]
MSAFDQVAALRHQNKELLERLRVKQKSYRQLRRGREREQAGAGREEQAGGGREGAGRGRERGSRQGQGEREQAGAGREGAGRGRRERAGRGRREGAGRGRERGSRQGAGEREQAGGGREQSRQGQGEREQAGAGREGAGRGRERGAGRGRERGSRQGEGEREQAGAGEREQAGGGRGEQAGAGREGAGRGRERWKQRGSETQGRGSETQGRGSETQGRGSETLCYTDQLLHLGNDRQRDAFIRETRRPKPILLPPHGRERKGATHVTFQSPEEASEGEGWSVRPFLGYDWIAGVLDADSSLSEKSEPFFTELRDFRQVNREECVHQEYMEAEQLDLLPLTSVKAPQVLDYSRDTHQCTHCYRVNSRLFAVPLDPQAACPVCKTPRSQRPAPSAQEPAFIRVSIPRSTLLPAYRYKAHRRKSFDPSDSLALPSHCLSGWSSTAPPAAPSMNSLDLKTSVEPETASSVLSTSALYLSQLVRASLLSTGALYLSQLLRASLLSTGALYLSQLLRASLLSTGALYLSQLLRASLLSTAPSTCHSC